MNGRLTVAVLGPGGVGGLGGRRYLLGDRDLGGLLAHSTILPR
ncbi:hypothetical protein [Streptomyces sp. CC77]|nr:hypothetical protein [Streptomyces sp. CC77]